MRSPGRSSFSRSRLYWNPEHPPPTTATRRPEPVKFSRSMVSFTMAAALSVSRTGGSGSLDVVLGCWVSVWVSIWAVYSDAAVFLGIQRAPAVDGQDVPGDVRLSGEEKDRSGYLLRCSDVAKRNAMQTHPLVAQHR